MSRYRQTPAPGLPGDIRHHFAALPLGAVVASAAGAVLHVNPAFCALVHREPEAVAAMGFPGLCALLDIPAERAEIEALLAAGDGWVRARQLALRPDGEKTWLRIHLARVRSPLGDDLVQLLAEDVTKVRRLMDFFRRRRRYKSVVERRLDPICHFLPDWSILFANSAYCRHFRRKRRDIVGENFLHLLSLEDRQRFIAAVGAIAPENPAVEVEHRLSWDQGQPRTIKWTIHGSFYRTGHLKDYQAEGVDVTDQRLAEERLFQADRLVSLGALVSGVAHEINNPNNFIMLNAPLVRDLWNRVRPALARQTQMQDDPALEAILEDVPRLLDGIAQGAARIRDIVGELKEFARRDDRREFDLMSVNTVAAQALALMKKTIDAHTARLVVDLAADLPPVKGRPQRLEQVVVNLVHNACLALTDPGQAIVVSTRYDEPTLSVQVCVRDEGAGMSPEVLAKVAEPFFSTRRAQGGTGLGLSLSRRIVKEHGGELVLESSPGRGTRALVILPMAL